MKYLFSLGLLLILILATACGSGETPNTNTSTKPPTNTSTQIQTSSSVSTTNGSAQTYEIGQTFTLNGLTFTVDKVERVITIKNTLGGASYKPANGKFLLVYYKFKGNSNADGAYDTAAIKVQDATGKYYDDLNGEDTLTDLAKQKKMQMLGFAFNDETVEKTFLDLYDVPDKDLSLVWLETVSVSPLKVKKIAEVKLNNIQNVTETITYGKAKEWYNLALDEAKKWHDDVKLMELHADNTSAAFRLVEKESEIIAGLKEAPMDGTAEIWKYYFMSQNADRPYMITISQGSLTENKEATMFLTKKYEDLKNDSDWKLDSQETLELTKTNVAQDISNGAFVTYSLYNGGSLETVNGQMTNVSRLRWQIQVKTIEGKVTTVEIDATSGAVLSVKTM
jgi:hypothetical protein